MNFQNIHASAQVSDTASLGQFINIGSYVIIFANAYIGQFASIGHSTSVGSNSYIGQYANIAERCTIENDVTISQYARIFAGTKIENGCILDKFANVGQRCIIGNKTFLSSFSSIGDRTKIGANVYIGQFASIQSDVTVNARAIIHQYAEIASGTTVEYKEVVIRTPTTYELYRNCSPITNIPEAYIEVANDQSSQPSASFNAMLDFLLDTEISAVKAKCEGGYMLDEQVVQTDLSMIKSLYLIQRYGLQRFKEAQPNLQANVTNVQIINNGQIHVNGFIFNSSYHFGENSDNNILKPDVKSKLGQLLAIEEDANRKLHVGHDTVRTVAMDILNGQRKVTVAKSSQQSHSQMNFNGNQVFNNVFPNGNIVVNNDYYY